MHVELSTDRLPGARPERAILFLHGILGSGANLRTIARRFVEARPRWEAWLVDLRGHGRSPKGLPDPRVAAAAADVAALAARVRPMAAVVGHSFGGKVALEAARRLAEEGPGAELAHVVTIDTMPGAREPERGGDGVLAVLDDLASLPARLPSKSAFVDAVAARGRNRTIAQWLAMSTEPAENGGVRFALDLEEIRALVLDYFALDQWPLVEAPPAGVSVHLVIAGRSSSYAPADRARAEAIAARSPRVTVDVLDTGHWVHTEDPEGLLRVLLTRVQAGA
jgi:pimeloyl-ACP methyl ester carboxylesterase